MKILALVLLACSFGACAQDAAREVAAGAQGNFDGTWKATYTGSTGKDRSGTVTIKGAIGQWDMDVSSRTNACTGRAAPIAVTRQTGDAITFRVMRSTVLEGCKDTTMALQASDADTVQGTFMDNPFVLKRISGGSSGVETPVASGGAATAVAPLPAPALAQPSRIEVVKPGNPDRPKPGKIQMFYFGGNDCPPCVAWRGVELPKLRNMEVFSAVEFTYVSKTVMSTVPAEMFLPADVKPYKAQLDVASGHNRGSAQTAIVVDGEVFDYYYGTRDAADIARRIEAIRAGGRYPFERCLELVNGYNATRATCARRVAPT